MTDDFEKPVTLVVDDDPVTRRLVRRALEGLACCSEILEASDGEEARELLRAREDVSLVLTDILMPRLDGLGLLRWGRAEMPAVAWIILSGLDTFDTAVEAIRLGAFDFLAKPPRVEEMRVSVRNALERRRLLQERERLTAELADANVHLRAQLDELEEKSSLLRLDLERAEIIQRALLPAVPPRSDRYAVHAVYRPGEHVGGDLYDVVRFRDRYLSLCIADATGHGVTAAMLSVLFKQCLIRVDTKTGEPLPPERVLEDVNRALCRAIDSPGLFLTAVYCLLDLDEGTVTIASAGHPPALLGSADGEVHAVRRTGPALGLSSEARYSSHHLRLAPDDRLLLFSDGLLGAGTTEGVERIGERLCRTGTGPGSLLSDLVEEANDDASGAEPEDKDDTTLLLLEMRGGSSSFDNGAAGPGRRTNAGRTSSGAVLYGESEETSFVALRGRVTWKDCDPFHRISAAILDEHRPLTIDLSGCEYLDSTCLGTVHELVAAGPVRVQGVNDEVRALFEELDMAEVLSSVTDAGPVPELYPVGAPVSGAATARSRIVRAHETLAALSHRNRERFRSVLDQMGTGSPG